MQENKPDTSPLPRQPLEIQEEYKKACSLLGDKYYRKMTLEAECEHFLKVLFNLNEEFIKASLEKPSIPAELPENPQETQAP